MKQRGFEVVTDKKRKFKHTDIILPARSTKHSAGYDFYSNEDITIAPGNKYTFWTDVKVYMLSDEVLEIYIRSSSAIKHDLVLKNQTGIIDSDYYSNVDNDGNIGICLENTGIISCKIKQFDKIAQGIFSKYLLVDNDDATEERVGGIGSTK